MSAPVTTSWTTITGSAGSFDAYLALPPAGSGPGLLLLQEIFGVNEHIRSGGRAVRAGRLRGAGARRVLAAAAPAGASATRPRTSSAAARWRWPPTAPRCSATWPMRCRRCARGPRCAAAASAPSATAWAGGWPTWPRPRPASTPRWPTTAAASRTCSTWRRASLPDAVPLRRARRQHPARARWTRCVRRCRPPAEVHVYDSADHGFNCWARGSYQAAERRAGAWPHAAVPGANGCSGLARFLGRRPARQLPVDQRRRRRWWRRAPAGADRGAHAVEDPDVESGQQDHHGPAAATDRARRRATCSPVPACADQ